MGVRVGTEGALVGEAMAADVARVRLETVSGLNVLVECLLHLEKLMAALAVVHVYVVMSYQVLVQLLPAYDRATVVAGPLRRHPQMLIEVTGKRELLAAVLTPPAYTLVLFPLLRHRFDWATRSQSTIQSAYGVGYIGYFSSLPQYGIFHAVIEDEERLIF